MLGLYNRIFDFGGNHPSYRPVFEVLQGGGGMVPLKFGKQ